MSNAASYVLVSVGIVDLTWVAGDRTVPMGVAGLWIAGWWGIRAGGQFAVGRRRGDIAIAALSACWRYSTSPSRPVREAHAVSA